MMKTALVIVAVLGVAAAGACKSDDTVILNKLAQLDKKLDQVKAACGGGRAQPEREEPAPDATFAVDVSPDVKGGQVEGPATACVTLIEAWDFA